jgi:hypothetical protein
MDPSFGTRLRLQRERQQVALPVIAAETKVKLSLLEGLERDDVKRWPDGIYRRAYLRAYARAIGLEPDTVIREFLEHYPDAVECLPAGSIMWAETDRESGSSHGTGLRRLVTSAMAAVPAFLHRPPSHHSAATMLNLAEHSGNGDTIHALDVLPATPDGPAHHDQAFDDRAHLVRVVEAKSPPHVAEAEATTEVVESGSTRAELSLVAAAALCSRLVRVLNRSELEPILDDAAAMLDAAGLIVWTWDHRQAVLTPSFASGYPEATVARMPRVTRDSDNAIAAAFRAVETCVVAGANGLTGAVVAPLVTPTGCVGVLAIEVSRGGEQCESVRAFVNILAAPLATLLGSTPQAVAVGA